MPRPTSFDCVCCPMACHATPEVLRSCVQSKGGNGMPDVVRPCALSKGDDGMSCLMSFDHVYCPKAVMTCHAQRRPTVRVVQGRWFHATPDIV